jgi:hypothetical protein
MSQKCVTAWMNLKNNDELKKKESCLSKDANLKFSLYVKQTIYCIGTKFVLKILKIMDTKFMIAVTSAER